MKKELFNKIKQNLAIFDAIVKSEEVLKRHKNIIVSVSGGADSDIVLDLLFQIGVLDQVKIVWFDTGLEYQATKNHLNYLEEKYSIKIERTKAVKPIPLACKQHGQPFMSKRISAMIERLQKHDFKWEDKPLEVLIQEYPKCKSALRWWCNDFGVNSRLSIGSTRLLKEFMILNPPTFKISASCCDWAKKKVAYKFNKENNIDLSITGIRKSEGGIRSIQYKGCFDDNNKIANYRPIFWFLKQDKEEYEKLFSIKHSLCYSKYNMDRTGCAGCPFGRNFEKELEIIEKYEPKLFVAVNNIFKESYEYTRSFMKYKVLKQKEKQIADNQLSLFDE